MISSCPLGAATSGIGLLCLAYARAGAAASRARENNAPDVHLLESYPAQDASSPVAGWVAAGMVARVTGRDPIGLWWRVICPDDTVGDCRVSADPTVTQPPAP